MKKRKYPTIRLPPFRVGQEVFLLTDEEVELKYGNTALSSNMCSTLEQKIRPELKHLEKIIVYSISKEFHSNFIVTISLDGKKRFYHLSNMYLKSSPCPIQLKV